MSTVTLELPDAILAALQAHGLDAKRFIGAAIAVEGYRQEILARRQIGELLAVEDTQAGNF